MKSVCDTGIEFQDKLVVAVNESGIPAKNIQKMDVLASEVSKTASHASGIAQVGQQMSKTIGQSRRLVQKGLEQIEIANRKIEQYASLPVLREAIRSWNTAYSTILRSKEILKNRPKFKHEYQSQIATALVQSEIDNVNEIARRIKPHLEKAKSRYQQAKREESTISGRAKRSIGRLWGNLKKKVSNSRIGKEVTLSFKTMVLGTQMFYEIMDMKRGDSMLDLAQRHESDMTQLMRETEEINGMDGWSITGKNTFVEDSVNASYQKSFKQE